MGIVTTAGREVSVSDAQAISMRDRLAHRGPDGGGLWRGEGAVLAHCRLAVIDPTPAGLQPMTSADGRGVLVYNGELYNDRELRATLESLGHRFVTRCDTETVLAALAEWGDDAAGRLRGMYALAYFDTRTRRLVLARDELGVKPLYWWAGSVGGRGTELVFASEPAAVLAHPAVRTEPDLVTLSAYLTTIRLTLNDRTLFAGVRTLRPGEWLSVDLSGDAPRYSSRSAWDVQRDETTPGAADVGVLLQESVRRQLRSDVPLCSLLSGGLDSSILASLATDELAGAGALSTYCAGAGPEAEQEHQAVSEDFSYASMMAERLGSNHRDVHITRESFIERWESMVHRMGVPLGTPNEVAIHAVSEAMAAEGHVVTLSGEGADELFGGYALVMGLADRFERAQERRDWDASGRFHLETFSWVGPGAKPWLLHEEAWRAAEHDAALHTWYGEEFAALADQGEVDDALQVHLRFLRRVNLAGLLLRLDSATMQASVEGRTPFADIVVCRAAERLPMAEKYQSGEAPAGERTKIALRDGFASALPPGVLDRPKASFPLPFQAWIGDRLDVVRSCDAVGEVFTEDAIGTVERDPALAWNLAWPMINAGMWLRRWWG